MTAGLLALLICAPPPKALAFREVLEQIRSQSPALQAARSDLRVADAEVSRAWTAWQPKIDAIGSLTFNSNEAVFSPGALAVQFGFPAPANPPPDTVIQPHVQAAAILAVRQTVFNMTAVRAPGVAKAGRRAAEASVTALEDELLFNGATLYAALAGLKGLDAAAERAIAVAERRLQDAKAQVEAGTATQLAVTRAETDKVAAEGQRISLRAERRALLASLRALAGLLEPIEVEDRRLEELVKVEGSRTEVRASVTARELAADAADRAIGLSDMAWMPSIAADAQLRYSNVTGFSDEKFLATATLSLVVPLYDQGVRYAETDAARARAAKAARMVEQEKLQAAAFLEDASAKLEASRSEVAQAEAHLRLATAAVAQVEALSANGLATNLELTDADSKRFAADQALAQKRLALDLAVLRLYYASGGKLL